MAESEGFEPPEDFSSTVFKTAAFDHSASSPLNLDCCYLSAGRRTGKLRCPFNAGRDARGRSNPAQTLAYYNHLRR